MPGDDEIDFGWADQPLPPVPQVPAADRLAAEIGEDDIKQAARLVQYDIGKFKVPSPFECKDALKHLGCRWTGKVWVARDAAMHKAAQDIVNLHNQRTRNIRPTPKRCGTFASPVVSHATKRALQNIPAGTVVATDGDEAIVQFGAQPDARLPKHALTLGSPDLAQETDERLASVLRQRGYTVAKLGECQTLAEILAEQGDEDPFAFLEEL